MVFVVEGTLLLPSATAVVTCVNNVAARTNPPASVEPNRCSNAFRSILDTMVLGVRKQCGIIQDQTTSSTVTLTRLVSIPFF